MGIENIILGENIDKKYGFYGRLKADFPSQIIVDITEICNLACSHCPHPEFRRSNHYNARHISPELNAKMVDEVNQYGHGFTQYIRYASNGEPLLHPMVYEMIEYAVIHSGVYVTLTTNGTVMNEVRMQKLIGSGIHMIDISIDAFTPETYAKIRTKGELNITCANVLSLIDWVRSSNSNTKVVVSFVEQPLNMHETKDFETFWRENGADSVVIRRLHSCSGAKSDLAIRRREDNSKKNRRPCLYPWERIVLNTEGFLTFCPADWFNSSPVTDYRKNTIRETWQGEFYNRLRDAHLANNLSEFKFCEQCPDWEATRWPWEGRSYADMIEEFVVNNKYDR